MNQQTSSLDQGTGTVFTANIVQEETAANKATCEFHSDGSSISPAPIETRLQVRVAGDVTENSLHTEWGTQNDDSLFTIHEPAAVQPTSATETVPDAQPSHPVTTDSTPADEAPLVPSPSHPETVQNDDTAGLQHQLRERKQLSVAPPIKKNQKKKNQLNASLLNSAQSIADADRIPAIQPPDKDVVLEVHFLFSLANLEENDAWEYLNLSINVTQNYAKDPSDASPPPDNSAQTMQQLHHNAGEDGKHVKEISVRINIKAPAVVNYRRYKFQLFCSIDENQDVVQGMHDSGRFVDWSSMESIVFVSYPEVSKALQPISGSIARSVVINRILINEPNFFLGSFTYDGINIYHDSPSRSAIEEKAKAASSKRPPGIPGIGSLCSSESVVIVPESDRVDEVRKARAGRPSHRVTGELLMTRSQAEKVIEIRDRWKALTPRQRRTHVSEKDMYTFLTLNRDEVAKNLPVCTTWFKDVLRFQGVKKWPGRPLRKTGARLQELKQQLCTEEAALQFEASKNTFESRQRNIARLKEDIREVLDERVATVKRNVSANYFRNYEEANGMQFLNPAWEALPPPLPEGGPHSSARYAVATPQNAFP